MLVLFETERLVLRQFTRADVDNLCDLDGDPEVMRFITGGEPTPRDVIRDEILPRFFLTYECFEGFGVWAAVERSTGESLGWFGFFPPKGRGPEEAELGYRLWRSAWGKGYAAEGSHALIHKGFTELGVRRVVTETMAVNVPSRRVTEKAGLTHVRTFHQEWPWRIEGDEHGDVEYAPKKADYRTKYCLDCLVQPTGYLPDLQISNRGTLSERSPFSSSLHKVQGVSCPEPEEHSRSFENVTPFRWVHCTVRVYERGKLAGGWRADGRVPALGVEEHARAIGRSEAARPRPGLPSKGAAGSRYRTGTGGGGSSDKRATYFVAHQSEVRKTPTSPTSLGEQVGVLL